MYIENVGEKKNLPSTYDQKAEIPPAFNVLIIGAMRKEIRTKQRGKNNFHLDRNRTRG